MPGPEKLEKAILQEIGWDKNGAVNMEGRELKVQFNPESLKVSFSNQLKGGGQAGGSAIQFAGRGASKLSFDLWFDVTDPNLENLDDSYKNGSGKGHTDVRRITAQVAEFMKVSVKGAGKKAEFTPPGTRFLWGSFLFEGVMESINETIEFFSEDGKPLRAGVSVSLSKQDVEVTFADPEKNTAAGAAPGVDPVEDARQDEPIQRAAARRGAAEQWPEIALANHIENPRHLAPGTPLKLSATSNGKSIEWP